MSQGALRVKICLHPRQRLKVDLFLPGESLQLFNDFLCFVLASCRCLTAADAGGMHAVCGLPLADGPPYRLFRSPSLGPLRYDASAEIVKKVQVSTGPVLTVVHSCMRGRSFTRDV